MMIGDGTVVVADEAMVILKLKTSHADEKYDRHDSDNLNRFVIHANIC